MTDENPGVAVRLRGSGAHPEYVVIDLEFPSTGEAEAYLDFLRTKARPSKENAPTLIGDPQARILEPVENA